MSPSQATLRELSKDEVINLSLDYQTRYDTTLTRINTDSRLTNELWFKTKDHSYLKQNCIKLPSEISVARQVNNKLKDHIVSLERQCWSNSQYSRWQCLETSNIPDKTDKKDLEDTALNVFRKLLNVEVDYSNIEDCHWFLVSEQGTQTYNHQIFKMKRFKQNSLLQEKLEGNGFNFTWHFFSSIY